MQVSGQGRRLIHYVGWYSNKKLGIRKARLWQRCVLGQR
jgi:hypothetical protein